jgi:hypothetical protein
MIELIHGCLLDHDLNLYVHNKLTLIVVECMNL